MRRADFQSAPIGRIENPSHGQHARRGYLLMLLSALAFSAMSACSFAAKDYCDWRAVLVTRAAAVFGLVYIFARSTGVRLVWAGPRTLWVRSIAGSVSMVATFYALTHAESVANVITLCNTFPLWVAVLAWPVLGSRPPAGLWLAIASGLAGVFLIEQPHQSDFHVSSILALAAAFGTAVVMLGLHRLRYLDAAAIVVHFSAVASVVCVSFAVIDCWVWSPFEMKQLVGTAAILLLLGIAVFATLGQLAMTKAFQSARPERLAVIGLTQVVFTLGLEVIFWRHQINAVKLFGIVLVLAPAMALARRAVQAARADSGPA